MIETANAGISISIKFGHLAGGGTLIRTTKFCDYRGAGMKCHQCLGPFGMVRHQLITFSGWNFFCSRKCKDKYRKYLQQARKRKVLDFASQPKATTVRPLKPSLKHPI
jgi:hypothetical protein